MLSSCSKKASLLRRMEAKATSFSRSAPKLFSSAKAQEALADQQPYSSTCYQPFTGIMVGFGAARHMPVLLLQPLTQRQRGRHLHMPSKWDGFADQSWAADVSNMLPLGTRGHEPAGTSEA